MHKLIGSLAAAGIAIALAGPALGAGATVKVSDNAFRAKTVHVSRGATVTWKWVGANAHNVTFAGFHSTTRNSGTYKHTFKKSGTFAYSCTLHNGMTGRVVVG